MSFSKCFQRMRALFSYALEVLGVNEDKETQTAALAVIQTLITDPN